jgi:hypothetical protein
MGQDTSRPEFDDGEEAIGLVVREKPASIFGTVAERNANV